jgi:CheY-like chemotaxis protein
MNMSGKQGIQILVVDDEPVVGRIVQLLLEHGGLEARSVASGLAALALLERHRFDVVITDFRMPGMKGDELAECIKIRRPDQPIILATGFADEAAQMALATRKVDALLLKPVSIPQLFELIYHVLPQAPPGFPRTRPLDSAGMNFPVPMIVGKSSTRPP